MLHRVAEDMRIQDPEGRIPADEPVFLLRASDPFAVDLVYMWANMAERAGVDAGVVLDVRRWAIRMGNWPSQMPPRPPVPRLMMSAGGSK